MFNIAKYKQVIMLRAFAVLSGIILATALCAQDAKQIVRLADERARGIQSSRGVMKMTIVRPEWSREVTIKAWSKGRDYSLMLVTDPPRDKGTAFLKRKSEIWNWQPSIDRTIKLPPSMMMQSWMGSDFTNDDLVRESSVIEDYEHYLLGSEYIGDKDCYKIRMDPKPQAPVVWGKVIVWIEKNDYLQLQTEFYDEDDYLVNTMYGKNIRELGGRLLPTVMEMVPAEEEGKKTMIEQVELIFDEDIPDDFFSIQNMKRVR